MSTFFIILSLIFLGLFIYTLKMDQPKKVSKLKGLAMKYCLPFISLLLAMHFFAAGTFMCFVEKAVTNDSAKIIEFYKKGMRKAAEEKNKEASKKAAVFAKDESQVKSAPIIGNKNAKYTIFEFIDYNCGYCKRLGSELDTVLAQRDDVRVVVKNLPILSPISEIQARASIAAVMQGKGEEFYKLMMTVNFNEAMQKAMKGKKSPTQKDMEAAVDAAIAGLAKKAGLDAKKLKTDMQSRTVEEELLRVRKAREELNINGTPAVIINGKYFGGYIKADVILNELK